MDIIGHGVYAHRVVQLGVREAKVVFVDSIEGLIDRLDAIVDQARLHRARYGYFAALYAHMTRAVRDGIASGRLQDPQTATELDVRFGNRYLAAFEAWRSDQSFARTWDVAFAATGRPGPLVMQHLLLGIHAHVNLDLGVSTATVLRELPDRDAFQTDFFEINAIIRELVDDVQSRVNHLSPWFGLIDLLGGRADESLFDFKLTRARDWAWSFANELAALPMDQVPRRIAEVDGQMSQLARRLASPGGWLGLAVKVVGLAEERDVQAVLRTLS
ncbi:MAG: hypothetical protein B7733_25005 [Myxococcales bacterium FL481]|nr:MAG: hypothetical protein B7733_25005 [Myxococcales bacterium FL481]